jgi:hypothetical protein
MADTMGLYAVAAQDAGIRVMLPALNAVCVTPVIPIIVSDIVAGVLQGFEIESGRAPQEGISIIKNEINTNPIRL